MIWPTDGLQLAVTKLKTRRIRLIVTVVITSLMFSVLAFLACMAEGVTHSLKSFGSEGYGSRYLVQTSPLTYSSFGLADAEFTDHFKPLQTDLIAQKKAAAKKLGLTYDPAADPNLPYSYVPDGKSSDIFPNFMSPLVMEYYEQKNLTIPGADFASFQKKAADAGATHTFLGTENSASGYGGPAVTGQASISILQNGQEKFDAASTQGSGFGSSAPKGIQTLTTMGWNSMDKELMQPFVLPGQNLDVGSDGSIPTIAPASVAEEVLGLKALGSNATPQEKLNRLVELRSKIAGKTADLCYRNSASASKIAETQQQIKEIEAGKKKTDYVKPTLVYQLPTTACGVVTVTSDTRSADEKKLADNQLAFDKQFGTYQEPAQGIVTVRIVGISPDLNYDVSMSAISILSSLFNSSMGGRWYSPTEAVADSPIATAIQGSNINTARRSAQVFYAEFSSLRGMQDFIKQQTCRSSDTFTAPTGEVVVVNDSNSYTKSCIEQKLAYMPPQPYGNSIGAIEQFRDGLWSVAKVAIIIILVIASIIMMGNVGKIIADSRRETAVFRALGAKGVDIDQIYLTYTLLVCTLVAIMASLIGFAAAYYVHDRYSADLSVTAVLAYSAQDAHKQFLLFGFNMLYFGAICALVVLAGIFGATVPLIANNRRNPIRDMRDDT